MRIDRLVILLLLAACKATVPTSSTSYKEDLSIHRPVSTVAEESSPSTSSPSTNQEEYTPLTGHIGAELDSIAKIAYEQNKKGRYVDGYVIQVYSGSSREDANEAQFQMAETFPELDPKVTYRQPSFRVKGGKFIDRLEANRVYNQVKKKFPKALLIPDRLLISYD